MVLRDYQRSKVYKAETKFTTLLQSTNSLTRLETVSEMQKFVDNLVNSIWFEEKWEVEYVVVKDGRGRRRAAGSWTHNFITMPKWCRDIVTILHELAHVCCYQHTKYAPEAQHQNFKAEYQAVHGQEYCKRMLALVEYVLGKEERVELATCYSEKNIRYMGSDYDWERERRKRYNVRSRNGTND